jgi:YebC/PmpR family DNA-binding regulatory protein
MSGHSKWAGIKHKKALLDAKKGKVFTKLIRELTVAARESGGDPGANPRLRLAIQKAKEANMPGENVERAVKRGTGELPGVTYEQVMYEGYGPGGVAIMVEALTDNKNRSTAELRTIFSRKGGNLAGSGSVAWLFHKKGLIIIDHKQIDEEKLMSLVLDDGAEDMTVEDDTYHVITDPKNCDKVKSALEKNNVKIQVAELTMVPASTVKVGKEHAATVLGLVETLEDHDDVQNVYANFDIPDEILKEVKRG